MKKGYTQLHSLHYCSCQSYTEAGLVGSMLRPMVTRDERSTNQCATPMLRFINVIAFPIHLYALPWTDRHVGCIIIAIESSS